MQYEPFGPLKQATLGNTLSMTNNWGNDGRLASRRLYVTSGGVNRSLLSYAYDNDDNIIGITDGVNAANTLAYQYDIMGRLSRATLASTSTATHKRSDFLYDANGNRTRNDRRTNATDVNPTESDIFTRTVGTNRTASIALPGGTRSITPDARGNLASETRPGGVTARLARHTARAAEAVGAGVVNKASLRHPMVETQCSAPSYKLKRRQRKNGIAGSSHKPALLLRCQDST
jgi:YD repeat-containing protein